MITEDQTEVIEFLSSRSTYGGASVDRVDTHSAIVFLSGASAWKLKRAVRYDYLDFSTVERRRMFCEAEVRLNRRTAPELYRGVVAVTREGTGALARGGAGSPVEWLVEMARFDQDALFDRLSARKALDLALMLPLAESVAQLHLTAERCPSHGGRSGMSWVIDGNVAGFAEYGAGILNPAGCERVISASRIARDRCGGQLDERRAAGFVRRCHGDLHLRNIVLLAGRPTLFDAVEFNEEIACIDVLYDLAFLLMDLWRRRLPRHAHAILNGYLSVTGDLEGLSLLPLFLSCRAAVRAKTSATAARLEHDSERRGELQHLAREYLQMADDLLRPARPCLIAVGGLSGSGKSTLALNLAPSVGAVPGAVVIRSDELRKQSYGVARFDRLGPEAYAPEASRRVYALAVERAAAAVRSGHSAIVDAVFAGPQDRAAIEAAAGAASVPFVGLWLDAPDGALIDRVQHRGLDPSDADADVVRMQRAQGTGPVGWHRIDASAAAAAVLQRATEILRGERG